MHIAFWNFKSHAYIQLGFNTDYWKVIKIVYNPIEIQWFKKFLI